MATTVITRGIPVGNTVNAYRRGDERPIAAAAPPGRPLEGSAAVASNGTVTFDLPIGSYWAIAQDFAGDYRWTAFREQAPMEANRTRAETDQFLYDTAVLGGSGTGGTGGVTLEDIPDASTADKGLTRLSTAPAVAATPIAVGTNDNRVTADQPGTASIRTLGTGANQAASGTDARFPAGADIVNADIAAAAAIAQSKLSLAVTNAEIAVGAAIAQSKLTLAITDAEVASGAAIAQSKIATLVADLAAKAPNRLTQVTQAAGFTLAAADAYKVHRCTSATGVTFTVPGNVFAAGDWFDVIQGAAGQVTMANGTSMTLRERESKLKTAGQWARLTVFFISATEAVVSGDVAA